MGLAIVKLYQEGMKEKLAAVGRAILGKHAHRIGLDARPLDDVLAPLEKLHKNLYAANAHHSKAITRNQNAIQRAALDNDRRRFQISRSERVIKNLTALLEL